MDFPDPAPLASGATPFPDLMNDPALDERERGLEDMDTCRICHGEGTLEEPLFYPCKCSGSIKFVHQSCLVEWLAHSQKKHCELCKTPFRFTKLYDPNMPQSLPTPLFIKQAVIQSFHTLITWLRFVLVAFVWLGWLPWSMRAIWRALFWLADGHWSATGAAAQQRAAHTAQSAGSQLLFNDTAAVATALNSAASAASSAISSAATAVPPTGDPVMLTLIKKVIPSLFIPALTGGTGQNGSNSNSTAVSPKARYPSWLSDVKFLNTLTPYPTINNMIIDTLEGQLITLLVVIAFILLFLIREWVVQQQPMANIAEGEREAALRLIANDRPDEQQRQQIPPLDFPPARPNAEFEGLQNDHPQEANDDIPPRFGNHSPAPSLTDSDDGRPILERNPGPHNRFAFEDEFAENAQAHDQRRQRMALYENVLANWDGERDELLRALQEQEHADRPRGIPEILQEFARNEVRDQEYQNAPNAEDAMSVHNNLPAPTGPIAELPAQPEDPPTNRNPTSETSANDQTAPTIGQLENHQPPTGISERLVDWFWGDVTLDDTDVAEAVPEDDEQIVQDPALEDPFVPVINNRAQDQVDDGPLGGGAPADDAGLDPNDMDAIEGDDFEGIMDLIGMQGPIFGLLQNGVFCALLIAFTVAIGIWLPYLWGKIALVLLANPLELIVGVPMTAISVVADIALDTLIGLLFQGAVEPPRALVPLGEWIPRGKSVTSASLTLIDASTNRLNKVMKAFLVFHDSDIPMFSVLSHQALRLHQARLSTLVHSAYGLVKFVLHDFPLRLVTLGIPGALSVDFDFTQIKQAAIQLQGQVGNFTKSIIFSTPGAKLLNADAVNAASAKLPVDYDLAVWDTKDRIIAISMGYLLASMMGFLYLRITGLLAGTNRGQRIEGMVAEVLLQAGGVMKVILIIGIEMIVFPLYCGTLLDVALLPLFSNATISSRIAFTIASPLTSLFVHWFVGTCYMFHFALFVSMCRKILRSGVLYFIRDPDDPTFHPIRDVLERTITTQLRKIGFSALVYGALVIVCLGGVVWGLHFAFDGILPIHWSASAPMLEFPVDLLFYNFVMPLAIQFVKPSDGLHELYDWWFHKCAHFLRLSNFLFTERHREEEGRHVLRSWWGLLLGSKGDWEHPVVGEEQQAAAEKENRDAYFLRDGRFVAAPASDQVRIPKGNLVFWEMSEGNWGPEGEWESDDGERPRFRESYTLTYIPPSFRTRIAAFILLIWLFAATTGVGITIIPLVIGRWIISICLGSPVPVNDIYAFSSGLCVVGGLAYTVHYCHKGIQFLRENAGTYACTNLSLHAARLAYIATALVVVLPTLFALLTELYILIPAHTLLGEGQSHVVHVIQDWTLGVLYVQMAIKLTVWHPRSWAAAVMNGIFRNGWLRPNVRLATRALVLPLLAFTVAAVIVPLTLGGILRWTLFYARVEAQSHVYRYAYPATLLVVLAAWTTHLVRRRVALWRINIRDDVYLIGERLHNFSEKRARDVGVSRRVITG
ncbi:hypothetical protein N7509_009660 [Penicillium cosmopolitanum]|uniref:RING-type E3 ubiquitin transferase n=1 Tax=Penicillium cosmopolitanum TaxID=1131564 RepID=A0A9W9VQ21_9EURO|nr:uncharacterized protein N7509_009660 [Penicillium cosmopolitanum]KAJ5387119.1 hypothetical protein N7509_009660 [Penicillium cosmopolitanum]